MSSDRTGLEVTGTARITGDVTINQNHITHYDQSDDKAFNLRDQILGPFPPEMFHSVPGEHRDSFVDSLSEFQTLIKASKSDKRPNIIIIHEPIWTGKSTFAHILMDETDASQFENRIWINAESDESIRSDFNDLYELMLTDWNVNKTVQEKLKSRWIYKKLLTHPTLLVFDNAAVIDFDMKSDLNDFYNLTPYLLLITTLLNTKNLVPPTVVITTRSVLNRVSKFTSKFHFHLSYLKLPVVQAIAPIDQDEFSVKFETDEKIMDELRVFSKVPKAVFKVLSLMEPEGTLLDLILHLYCNGAHMKVHFGYEPTMENFKEALRILEDMSLLKVDDNGYVRVLARSVIQWLSEVSWDDMRPIFQDISDMVCTHQKGEEHKPVQQWMFASDRSSKNYDMDIKELDRWARNLNLLLSRLYPDMVKNELSVSPEFTTFALPGNSYKARYESLVEIRDQVLPAYLSTDEQENNNWFHKKMMETVNVEIEVIGPILGIFDNVKTDFPHSEMIVVALWGDYTGALDKYSGRNFEPGNSTSLEISHSLYMAECYLKLSNYEKASETVELVKDYAHIASNDYFYSALPPEVIEASILKSQGRYLEAQQNLKSALELSTKTYGRHSYTTAAIEHELAKIESAYGNFEHALQLIDHSIAVHRQLLGVTTIRSTKTFATKAKILALRGNFDDAFTCLANAKSEFLENIQNVNIEISDFKLEHYPCPLMLRYHQAKVLWLQENYTEVLKEAEFSLQAIETSYNEEKPANLLFKSNLLKALILARQGDHEDCKDMFFQLANTVRDDAQALKLYADAAANHVNLIFTSDDSSAENFAHGKLNDDETDTVSFRLRAKSIKAATKKLNGEDGLLKLLHEIAQESVEFAGPFHVQTLGHKANLAKALLDTSAANLSDAKKLIEETCNFLESSGHGKNSPVSLKWRLLRALLLLETNEPEGAEVEIRFLREHFPQPFHPVCATAIYAKARFEARSSIFESAYNKMYDLVHEMLATELVNNDGPDFGEVTSFLAFLCLKIKGQEDWKETVNWCNTGLIFTKSSYEKNHFRTIQAKLNVATVYGVLGREEIATKHFDQLLSSTSASQDKFPTQLVQQMKQVCSTAPKSDSSLQEFVSKLHFENGLICHEEVKLPEAEKLVSNATSSKEPNKKTSLRNMVWRTMKKQQSIAMMEP